MKTYLKFAIFALVAPLVAACSSIDLNTTMKAPMKGSEFESNLFKEYVELARMEDDEGDSEDAVYFNNRALMAAAGKDTGPQAFSERGIPSSAMDDMKKARAALLKALPHATKTVPAAAARAQAMFDCWMQEQEENNQPEDIARCRSAFEDALKDISPMMAKKPMMKKMMKPAAAEFIVYFGFDSAKVDLKGMSVVGDVLKAYNAGRKLIILTGNTDTSGDKVYNRKLSEKRAEAVKAALVDLGVPDDRVLIQYYGEDKNRVKTADGVKEAGNRRVEVVVK